MRRAILTAGAGEFHDSLGQSGNILERSIRANNNKPVTSPSLSLPSIPRESHLSFFLLFLFLYLFQVFFGLCESQWWERDEIQTYLIGLKCYTTQTWPYFGPDVTGAENTSFQSQIPGALEGLLIGLPFYLCPTPEAPFFLLGLLNTLGAAFLSWYIHRRLPSISRPRLMLWICVTPWMLEKCAHIINPAYDCLPSVLFFIGFLETLSTFRLNLLKPYWANAAMGFSIFWIMQFHFSYVYLLPLAAYSFYSQAREGRFGAALGGFFCGAAPMAALILPTWLRYGFVHSNVASGFTAPFNWQNVLALPVILARYLSLVCFEIPRYLGDDLLLRIKFLTDRPWLLVPGAILWIGGLVQASVLFLAGFLKRHPAPLWAPTRNLTALCFLMVWVSFWFTIKLPLSHIYLVFYPLLMLYSCYVLSLFTARPKAGFWARVFLILGLYFQLGYAVVKRPQDSLYPDRARLVSALEQKDYRLFQERRPGSLY